MKTLFVFSLLVAFCLSNSAFEDDVPNFDMDAELSPEELQLLKELLAKELNLVESKKLEQVAITVLLNEYMDKIFANIAKLIIDSGLDPTSMPDLAIDIGIGHTNLTEGQLNDTSTIQRYENATLTYDNESKLLMADMVVRFEDLKFIYKYHTKVTFISMTGHLHGDVEHIHINIRLGFDFSEFRVFVDSINFKHTGSISITFSGNALIDWITNAMSFVITGILHDLILNMIKSMIADPINSIVDAINQILHPSLAF